jgi:hypothetical protein
VKTSSRDRCASKKKPDHTKHGERDHQILGIPELRVHEPPTVTVKENVRSVSGLHLTAQSIVTAQQLTGMKQGCTVSSTRIYRTYQIRRICKVISIVRDKIRHACITCIDSPVSG